MTTYVTQAARHGALIELLVQVGEQFGLMRILRLHGAMTSPALASHAGVDERSLGDWLDAMVDLGFVEFDASTLRYSYCTGGPENGSA